MGWILEGLIETLMSLAGEVIEFCMTVFADFDIDIGYLKTAPWSELFSPTYYKNATGLLDSVFPTAQYFFTIFMYLGYALAIMIAFFMIMSAMLGPLSKAEHPVKIAASLSLSLIGVTYSYTLFTIAERIANYFYNLFKDQFIALQGVGLPSIKSFLASPSSLFKEGSVGAISGIGLSLVALVLFVTLIIQFVKLMLEMFERYVMLGVLFYTSPLAFSTIASDSTRRIFSSWTQMVISQFLLMLMNLFFLGMFYAGFIVVFAPGDESFVSLINNSDGILQTLGYAITSRDYIFSGAADFLCKMFILIGWLTVGQKVDEHLRALGLSVSTSGRGIGDALAAGAYSAMKVIKGAGSLAKGAGRAADRINRGRVTAQKNDDILKGRAAAADKFANTPLSDKGKLAPNMSETGYKKGLSRHQDGTLTKEGAYAAVNAPRNAEGQAIAFDSKDAKACMEALSLHPDEMGPNGERPVKQSLSDGKFTSYDSTGDSIREVGDGERYKADGAEISYNTPLGRFIEPATQSHIDNAAEAMQRDISSRFDGEGISFEMGRNSQGHFDGTMVGYDSKGVPVCQAALDQVATMNPDRGGVLVKGNESLEGLDLNGSKMTYSVQNLNDPHSRSKFIAGYDNVAKASSSHLQEKTVAESNETYVASHGNEGFARFMRAENAARAAVEDPYPVEDRYVKMGRVINKVTPNDEKLYSTESPKKNFRDKVKDLFRS